MTPNANLDADYAYCRGVCRAYAQSYYLATLSLPPAQRRATYALYAFVRLPDEIVDNPEDSQSARDHFEAWCADWERTLETGASPRPEQRAFVDTVRRCDITPVHTRDFLSAMRQDFDCRRYETYADLERYMHGSAAVVGLMMCQIVGVLSPAAYLPARRLGEAFQMTNFLRDVREDFARGRIYLPLEDLQQFRVTESAIGTGTLTPELRELLRFEVGRTRALYAQAEPGIMLLRPEGRRAVRVAYETYGAILNKIEQAQYDVFKRRLHTGKWEKLILAGKALRYG